MFTLLNSICNCYIYYFIGTLTFYFILKFIRPKYTGSQWVSSVLLETKQLSQQCGLGRMWTALDGEKDSKPFPFEDFWHHSLLHLRSLKIFCRWFFRKSSTHLAPYILITALLTIFPELYFTFLWLFFNCQLILLNSFPFFHFIASTHSCLAVINLFSVSEARFLFYLFIYFVF